MKKLIILTVLISLVSCSKTLTVDEEYQHPEIVLNGVFCPEDDTLDFFVTETEAVFGFPSNYKNNLDVELLLFENENMLGAFSKSDVIVSSDQYSSGAGTHYQIALNDVDVTAGYTVQVQHPTMGIASAEAFFPTKVDVESIELKEERILNEYGEAVDALVAYVTFEDPPGEDNYYQVQGGYYLIGSAHYQYAYDPITGYEVGDLTDTIAIRKREFSSHYDQIDPLINPNDAELIVYTENMFQVFNDDVIDGEKYVLRYVVKTTHQSYYYVSDGDTVANEIFQEVIGLDTAAGEFCEVVFNLRSIPKDLYLYYITLDAFYWNDEVPFVEPVQIHTNVENGVGIVAGYLNATKSTLVGDYPKDGVEYIYYDW